MFILGVFGIFFILVSLIIAMFEQLIIHYNDWVETDTEYVTADEKRVLGHEVGKVYKRRSTAGQSWQHQNLWLIVLHVLLHLAQLLHGSQCILVRLGLSRWAPVDIWNYPGISKNKFCWNFLILRIARGWLKKRTVYLLIPRSLSQ